MQWLKRVVIEIAFDLALKFHNNIHCLLNVNKQQWALYEW